MWSKYLEREDSKIVGKYMSVVETASLNLVIAALFLFLFLGG